VSFVVEKQHQISVDNSIRICYNVSIVNEQEQMMKITAKEARELAGLTVQERVEAVYPMIRGAAEKRLRQVALHGDFWANEGYRKTPQWKEACELLRKEGFTVRFFYEERQFVDMYTVVEW